MIIRVWIRFSGIRARTLPVDDDIFRVVFVVNVAAEGRRSTRIDADDRVFTPVEDRNKVLIGEDVPIVVADVTISSSVFLY
jgi:hypothetical protein